MKKGSLKLLGTFAALSLSIIGDKEKAFRIAEKAVNEALKRANISPRFFLVLTAVLTKRYSLKEYMEVHGAPPENFDFWTYTKPNTEIPTEENAVESDFIMICLKHDKLDVLLLCGTKLMTSDEACDILDLNKMQCSKAYSEAMESLEYLCKENDESPLTLGDLENEINNLAAGIEKAFEIPQEKSKKPPEYKREWIHAAWGFAILDIIAMAAVIGIYFFACDFLKVGKAAVPVEFAEMTESFPNYAITQMPVDFRRFSHIETESYKTVTYKNCEGKNIKFTQHVNNSEILSFDNLEKNMEKVEIKNNSAIMVQKQDEIAIYWYNGRYAYILSGNLTKIQLLAVADSILLGGDDGFSKQSIHLKALPADYTPHIAKESGDIINREITPESMLKLEDFYRNYLKARNDAIRISEFNEDGVIIMDLQTESGKIYITWDKTRSEDFSSPEIEGREYNELKMESLGGGMISLILNHDDGEASIILYP